MSFAATIIHWFRRNGRALPWRETRDPYAIWLSEVILQQTRVEQGRPYWERFMRRWPTVEDLAGASEDEVLREWQGLGYYSRARNLLTAARQIVALGHFPDNYDDIRKLKGVGDYTAAAVGSIAFHLPVAVVDGNVYRVLSRYFGISTPVNTTEGKKEFAALAQSLVEVLPESFGSSEISASSLYNQGLMDFGALQCTPANPACNVCPLADSCAGLHEDRVGELPVKRKRGARDEGRGRTKEEGGRKKERRMTYIYIRYRGETALHRRPAGDIWQGLYEPLTGCEGGTRYEVRNCEEGGRRKEEGGRTKDLRLLRRNVKHVLTHRIIYADFYLWEPEERPELPADYFWIKETDIDRYGIPRLVELLLEELNK